MMPLTPKAFSYYNILCRPLHLRNKFTAKIVKVLLLMYTIPVRRFQSHNFLDTIITIWCKNKFINKNEE